MSLLCFFVQLLSCQLVSLKLAPLVVGALELVGPVLNCHEGTAVASRSMWLGAILVLVTSRLICLFAPFVPFRRFFAILVSHEACYAFKVVMK